MPDVGLRQALLCEAAKSTSKLCTVPRTETGFCLQDSTTGPGLALRDHRHPRRFPHGCRSAEHGSSRRAPVPAPFRARTLRTRPAARQQHGPRVWSGPAPQSVIGSRHRDALVPVGWRAESVTGLPQPSCRHSSTTSISRRRAASLSFSHSCRWDAPEPTSFTCSAIVQPRGQHIRAWRGFA